MSQKIKTLTIWVALTGIFIFLYTNQLKPKPELKPMNLVEFEDYLEQGGIKSLRYDIHGNYFVETTSDNEFAIEQNIAGKAYELAQENHVPILEKKSFSWLEFLIPWAPIVIIVLVGFLFLKRVRGSSYNYMSLRTLKIKHLPKEQTLKFEDIGGLTDAKRELTDICNYLLNPQAWLELGIRMPRGVLLEGPPGCGKTLLARALASEAKAAFFPVSASDFVELFVGVGSSRVRDLFEQANKAAPSIIFIDEIDAIGRRRGSGNGYNNDEREQTLNQLLVSMDGMIRNDEIVVIAATNRADILDPALVRAGRFDKLIKIPLADYEARFSILKIHSKNKKLVNDFDYSEVSKLCVGLNGAELETLCNEAGLIAARRTEDRTITQNDFKLALKNIAKSEFSLFDSQIMNSAFYLNRSNEQVQLELEFLDGTKQQGELLWIDPHYLKMKGEYEYFISKNQLKAFRRLSIT